MQLNMNESARRHLQQAGERIYTEQDVKDVLYSFARDIERVRAIKPWRADKLRRFVASAFPSDAKKETIIVKLTKKTQK